MKNDKYSKLWFPLTNLFDKENSLIDFVISEVISPYFELNDENLNLLLEDEGDITIIEVNPYIRFSDIFFPIIKIDSPPTKKEKIYSNLILHYLGNIDIYLGNSKKDFYIKRIIKEISNGDLGKDFMDDFHFFNKREKFDIADAIYEMYHHLKMIEAFKLAIKKIFLHSIVYDHLISGTDIIIYLDYKEDVESKLKLEFLKKIFLPIDINLNVFWKKHFGIIGVNSTMKLDEIAIF